jgi:two-component system cell cycle sensor histidine kinase/response regulator CckA
VVTVIAIVPSENVAVRLAVDDELQVLSFISELLRMQGYRVQSTWDPDEALRLACAHAGPLHLLLLDLVMPAVTGQELAREVRAALDYEPPGSSQ